MNDNKTVYIPMRRGISHLAKASCGRMVLTPVRPPTSPAVTKPARMMDCAPRR